jgi:hypothetical protein
MNRTYDDWKTTDPTDCPSVEDECPRDCEGCPTCQPEEPIPPTEKDSSAAPVRTEPPVGTYAYTARQMAQMFPDFDWDAWKDEMKERGE